MFYLARCYLSSLLEVTSSTIILNVGLLTYCYFEALRKQVRLGVFVLSIHPEISSSRPTLYKISYLYSVYLLFSTFYWRDRFRKIEHLCLTLNLEWNKWILTLWQLQHFLCICSHVIGLQGLIVIYDDNLSSLTSQKTKQWSLRVYGYILVLQFF